MAGGDAGAAVAGGGSAVATCSPAAGAGVSAAGGAAFAWSAGAAGASGMRHRRDARPSVVGTGRGVAPQAPRRLAQPPSGCRHRARHFRPPAAAWRWRPAHPRQAPGFRQPAAPHLPGRRALQALPLRAPQAPHGGAAAIWLSAPGAASAAAGGGVEVAACSPAAGAGVSAAGGAAFAWSAGAAGASAAGAAGASTVGAAAI